SCRGLEFLFYRVGTKGDVSRLARDEETPACSESNSRQGGRATLYNAVEVTGIVTKTFLGLPYAVVSAHPRHVQENCYLDGAEARRLLTPGQNFTLPSRILRQTSREKGASLLSSADRRVF